MPRTASPTPKRKSEENAAPVTSPFVKVGEESIPTMDFYQALRHVTVDRGYVTKLEWNNPKIFMGINGDMLCLYKEDNLFHPFLLRDVDITGTDWVFIGDVVVMQNSQAHQKE